jgi:hypothetical protein
LSREISAMRCMVRQERPTNSRWNVWNLQARDLAAESRPAASGEQLDIIDRSCHFSLELA